MNFGFPAQPAAPAFYSGFGAQPTVFAAYSATNGFYPTQAAFGSTAQPNSSVANAFLAYQPTYYATAQLFGGYATYFGGFGSGAQLNLAKPQQMGMQQTKEADEILTYADEIIYDLHKLCETEYVVGIDEVRDATQLQELIARHHACMFIQEPKLGVEQSVELVRRQIQQLAAFPGTQLDSDNEIASEEDVNAILDRLLFVEEKLDKMLARARRGIKITNLSQEKPESRLSTVRPRTSLSVSVKTRPEKATAQAEWVVEWL